MEKENESCRSLLAATGITVGALALFCVTASPEVIRYAVGGFTTTAVISCSIAVCALRSSNRSDRQH